MKIIKFVYLPIFNILTILVPILKNKLEEPIVTENSGEAIENARENISATDEANEAESNVKAKEETSDPIAEATSEQPRGLGWFSNFYLKNICKGVN